MSTTECINEFNEPYQFIRDNYHGDGGYNPYNANYSYLIQHPRELNQFYNDRRRNSVLENLFAPLQDLFLEPIWATNLQTTFDNKTLDKINKQTKVVLSANESLLDFKLYGKCIYSIYTDVLETGIPDINVLPDINKVFPADVIKFEMDGLEIDSAMYKEHRMLDKKKIPVLVEYSGNLFTMKTLAWRLNNKTIVFNDLGEAKRVKDFDGYKYGTLTKLGLKLDDIPKTFNLAQIQKQLFNLDTQRLDSLRKSGFPVLVIQTDDTVEQISMSQNTILKVPNTVNNMPEYLEPDLNGVELTTEIIEEKKSTVYKVFTNGLFSDNLKYTSTMSSIIATKSFKNTVDTFYTVYKEILTSMFNDLVFIYGLNTTFKIDFPVIDLASEEEMEEQTKDILS